MLCQACRSDLLFQFLHTEVLCRITGNQEFRVTGLSNQGKRLYEILNAFAGREQSEKQDDWLTGRHSITLSDRVPVMGPGEILEQPAGIPMRDDMRFFIINKRVQG